MRAVWMPSFYTRFSPNIEYIIKALPDVAIMEVIFPELSIDNRYEPHVAKECNFTFMNGNVLNVPGYMLWKFLDLIPSGLGSEEAGYLDENIFTNDYGENLMQRIRLAYQAVFIDTIPEGLLPICPIKFVLNLKTGKTQVSLMPKLSKKSEQYISSAFSDYVDEDYSSIRKSIAEFIKNETSEPQFDMGFEDAGNGTLRRTIIRKPWPNLLTITFAEFLRCFSVKKSDDCPAQKTQGDLFSEVILNASRELTPEFVNSLRNKDSFFEMANEIGCTSAKPTTKTFLKYLDASEHRFLIFNVLWSHVYAKIKSLSIEEIINIPNSAA
ncbi:hypothetical protein [Rhodoferax antarcticus]|uniref:Uncharacterized protein n=1 Tax=Rhodoferax antarcticus ANT.BR TaxID=1111071 RepID=A0A1Q8Y9E0_9BURK|nr:hypothetical protein [Rhodoferax antarcticus]OLP04589.1 hypothetical protein BLL52_4235 [Rhodoferax antarcticus ANT.BR]